MIDCNQWNKTQPDERRLQPTPAVHRPGRGSNLVRSPVATYKDRRPFTVSLSHVVKLKIDLNSQLHKGSLRPVRMTAGKFV